MVEAMTKKLTAAKSRKLGKVRDKKPSRDAKGGFKTDTTNVRIFPTNGNHNETLCDDCG